MKALVLIDVQNDFIDGSLGSEWAQRTVPKIVEFLKAHPEYEVFATRDTHFDKLEKDNHLYIDGRVKYEDSLEGKRLPIKHCIEGTHGWELSDLVKPFIKSDDYIADKPTFMALDAATCYSNRLFGIIETTGLFEDPEEIVACGFVTSICVVANALYLRGCWPNTKISVIEDLCADISEENHKAALTVMQANQIDIVKSKEI